MALPFSAPARRAVALMLNMMIGACGSSSTPMDTADDATGSVAPCVTDESTTFDRPFEVDASQYPFDSCAYETGSGLLHYVDAGPRDATHTVVMVHGNPTWSFLYRNIARELVAEGHRVIIPDHLGMGMSEAPSTASFDYLPRSHSENLERLVVALDLGNVTLVVQDWGGPIGLGMATRQPDRIASILVMNTWAWSIDPENPGTAHALIDWSNRAKQTSIARRQWFCEFAFPGQSELNALAADPTRGAIYEAVLAAYLSPAIDPVTGAYRTDEPCAPMQILAESILGDDAYQAEVEAELPVLQGKPYALVFGLSDILFGGLRCDIDSETSCPSGSTCMCDPRLLPSRVKPDCGSAPKEYHVCVEPNSGSVLQPYPDRFVELLGESSLVLRGELPESDHMVQEYAPEAAVNAIRALVSSVPE